MCGFVVWIAPSGHVAEQALSTMRDRLTHRGPDSAANWIEPQRRIGMGFRRLSILDTRHVADQPMRDAVGKATIVFNGEIYNYLELREELQSLGHQFVTKGDTEVLLHAYLQWGHACLDKLNGMFAFALWDETAGELFVARDRFGEKPLFMGRTSAGDILFASEMKAILAHADMPAMASPLAVDRFIKGAWYEDDALTFFEGIERMPPAYAARFDLQGRELSRWRYWSPDYTPDATVDEGQAPKRFLELLKRSVTMRLRADVPVGSSLSGGLDSSAIVGIIAQERQRQTITQHTFSACFDEDPTISETPFIEEVVKQTGVTSFRVNPSPEKLIEECAQLHWHQEEPFLSASIYLQWCVARLAQEHNTTVLLDGQGADELLGGYQFWYKQHQLDLLDQRRYVAAFVETYRFNRRLRQAAKHYAQSTRRFSSKSAYSMLQVLALCFKRPNVWHMPYTQALPAPQPGKRLLRTMSEALLYNSLPMLLRYADRNAMAFSRESRMPFLDHDLVNFVTRLPVRQLLQAGWQKWVLRKSTKGIVPDCIRWRADKVGYAAPLDIWLRGALKDWAHARLFSAVLAELPGYDEAALRELWEAHQTGVTNHSWALWRWISLHEWFTLLHEGVWSRADANPFSKPTAQETMGTKYPVTATAIA